MIKNEDFRGQLKNWQVSDQAIETLEFFGIENIQTFEEMTDSLLEKMSKLSRFHQNIGFGDNQTHQVRSRSQTQNIFTGFDRRQTGI